MRGAAGGLDVATEARVTELRRSGEMWALMAGEEVLGEFDRVILAVPAPQAAELLKPTGSHLATSAQEIEMSPCWSVMLGFSDSPEFVRQVRGR